jgi:hypothetical protein
MESHESDASCIVKTRTIVCFLVSGQKPPHEYAILTRAYDSDVDDCCTCLGRNDRLQTYGFKDVNLAIKRLNNKNDYCPLKKNIPTAELQELLRERILTMSPSLHDVVAEMEAKFRNEVWQIRLLRSNYYRLL